MNRHTTRPRLQISHGPKKKEEDFEPPPNLGGGNLTPDLQPCSQPFCLSDKGAGATNQYIQVGSYIVNQAKPDSVNCTAVDQGSGEEFTCKVLPLSTYRSSLAGYLAADGHPHVASIDRLLKTNKQAFAFFPRNFGDLHSYVREKKRLQPIEAQALAQQMLQAISHCHDRGLVLRDLKLRKFVFTDAARTQLVLDGLEEAVVLEEGDTDTLKDKHGCPAYVSPEILGFTSGGYSGRKADLWGTGVMIYTMLVGRYPFQDREPMGLFDKIRRGLYRLPPGLPARAACLVKALLQLNPAHRLTAAQALDHPWLSRSALHESPPAAAARASDQLVPCVGGAGHGAQDVNFLL